MRISYLLPAPGVPLQGPSGASAHARGLAGALLRRHDTRIVAALAVDHRGRFGDELPVEAVGVPGWPSWLERWRDQVEVRAARRVANRVTECAHAGWRPDAVIERHALFSDAGWRIHDRLGVPWVLEVNAPLADERARFETLRRPDHARRWERDVLLAAPIIAAVSPWLVRWLQQDIGCRNVHLVPNGTGLPMGDRARGRRRLGLPDDRPAVGFVGSMKAWHGVDQVAAVAKALGGVGVLIGRGDPTADVVTTGHLDGQDLADAIAALDVGLAPYPQDAPPWFCPLKLLDYRSQGTPFAVTDAAEVGHLVGEGGTVVPRDRPEALVEAARSWLGRRPQPWRRSWDRVAAEVLSLVWPAG